MNKRIRKKKAKQAAARCLAIMHLNFPDTRIFTSAWVRRREPGAFFKAYGNSAIAAAFPSYQAVRNLRAALPDQRRGSDGACMTVDEP